MSYGRSQVFSLLTPTLLLCYLSSPFFLLELVLTWFMTYFSNLRPIILLCLPGTLHNHIELPKVFHHFMDKSAELP